MIATKKKTTPAAPKMTQAEVRGLPDAAPGLKFYVIGRYCWGQSSNAMKAVENARREGGSGEFTIHLVNTGAEVDVVDGTLRYNSRTPGLLLNVGRVRA